MGMKFIILEMCKKAGVGDRIPLLVLAAFELALTLYLILYAYEALSVQHYCLGIAEKNMPGMFSKGGMISGMFLNGSEWLNRTYTIEEVIGGIKEKPP
jgi:hypothetical protein